jgi:hypothetical protein
MILFSVSRGWKRAEGQKKCLIYVQAWLASGACQGTLGLTQLSLLLLKAALTHKGRGIRQMSLDKSKDFLP